MFQNINDPSTVTNKFILSSYVADFPVGSSLVQEGGNYRGPIQISKTSVGRSDNKTTYKSVVEVYHDQLNEQRRAKLHHGTGLDLEFTWISVNALILIGCLKCKGTDHQKSEVFYRVVQPEMTTRVLCFDRDIKMSVFFLTNMATVLEFMQ